MILDFDIHISKEKENWICILISMKLAKSKGLFQVIL